MVRKPPQPPELPVVERPNLVVRNVLPLRGNVRRSPAAPALLDDAMRPDRAWRDLIRKLTKNPVTPKPGR